MNVPMTNAMTINATKAPMARNLPCHGRCDGGTYTGAAGISSGGGTRSD